MKLFLSFVLLFLSSAVSGEMATLQPMALVEDEFSSRATVDIDACRASLERPNNHVSYLHFRNDCPQSLEEKLALLSAMIEMLIPDTEDRQTIRTLFVGRLVLTFPDIAQRLAKAASESSEWDAQRAWKEPGYSTRFVLQLLQQDHLFPELQEAMAGFGFQVHIASVEKILMAKPHDIKFGDWLLEQGAHPTIKLPFDALTWFHLEPGQDVRLPTESPKE
ncbi:MAG: hypothetical protein OEZ57_05870 [Nitrospirota bacterium]|nr:hypothetical protein [Nitrospirota bacterium]MDH5586491.1 hypothetical protein [Nitrospirota bacterium]MDH5774425.1 hypothetical protein [Nitrospirota bacterium]